jgi:methylglutaconyl-CoA hydratase
MKNILHVDTVNGITTLTLNQPEKHNAFDDELIQRLIRALSDIANDDNTRVVILRSEGKNFSAGADLGWMKRMAQLSYEDNLADAAELARLMKLINELPQPTIALVQGAAYGGAVGLVCCCDIAIGTDKTRFCLSEVKIGLAAATISPFVVNAIGQRQARRYMLTAEVINSETAQNIGLLHQVVTVETLREQGQALAEQIAGNAPNALKASKAVIRRVANADIDSDMMRYTEELIARLRMSDEGQEGLSAFFEKREPVWPSLNVDE